MSPKKKMPSKGFFAALAVCLVGAIAAGYGTLYQVGRSTEQQNDQLLEETRSRQEETVYPRLEDVARPQSEIEKSSSTEDSSSSASSASSAQQPASSILSPAFKRPSGSAAVSYAYPLDGKVIGTFSGGELVKSPTLGDWRTHDGIDIAGAASANVKAAAAGTVSKVQNDPLWGTVIEVTHADKLVTVYSGLAANTPIRKGDTVKAGATLGVLGTIPAESSMESHLHFAVRKNGKYIDPLSILKDLTPVND